MTSRPKLCRAVANLIPAARFEVLEEEATSRSRRSRWNGTPASTPSGASSKGAHDDGARSPCRHRRGVQEVMAIMRLCERGATPARTVAPSTGAAPAPACHRLRAPQHRPKRWRTRRGTYLVDDAEAEPPVQVEVARLRGDEVGKLPHTVDAA